MKQQKQKPNAGSYSSIGKGEYELHVLIQSTSGLSLVSDGSINPKIAVCAFGQTEYTQIKSKVGVQQTYWGQHIYIKTEFSSSQLAQNQRLLIEVYDYNRLTADSLVGNYEIDIQRIYSEKNHTIQHTWLALSNIQKNFSQITGYVKISASLIGENDQNIQLDVQPIASITKEKKVLVPPHIQRKTYQIVVDVIQGRNIKPADGNTVDSYIGVQFGQIYSVSQTIPKNCNPKYDTRVYLPLSLPAVVQNIAFRLNDFNFVQRVQVLGSYYLNISQLIKKYENVDRENKDNKFLPNCSFQDRIPFQQFQWVNFYGPQLQTSRQQAKNIQQLFPQLAPYYVGSVLMRVKISENSQPQIKKQKITNDQKKKFMLSQPPLYYKIVAKITAALNVLQKNKKYKVSIRVGAQQIQTEYSQAKNGFCFWNEQRSFVVTVTPYQTIPDIFVYLVDEKGQKVCYNRYKPKDGQVLEDQWCRLTPDLALVNIQNQQAGYLKIGIDMSNCLLKEQAVVRKMNSPLLNTYNSNKKSGRLVIDLLCGQSLIPLDEDGSIDPFFTFSFLQYDVTSTTKNQALNPVYYERLIIQTDIMDGQGCPPIIVNAWDKDKLSNQFLGTTFIDVDEAIKNKSLVYGSSKNPQPYWYNLTQNEIVSGKFLVNFRLLPNFTGNIPREIILPKKTYNVALIIMGLRGLKNSKIISVKQPFIEFDFAGLDVYNTETSKQLKANKLIVTQPKQKGRSVNINSVIPAKVVLPDNYKYWPALSAKVKDNVLGSFYQPILGYFSIDLQRAYQKSKILKQKFSERAKALTMNKTQIVNKPTKLARINDVFLMSMRNFIMKSLNYNWKILDESIEGNLNSIKKNPDQKINEDYIVIFPNYQKQKMGKIISQKNDEKEEKYKIVEKYKQIIVKNQEYMQIGFDDIKTRQMGTSKRNKHYRFVLNEPYEKYFQRVNKYKLGVMEEIPIRIGRVFATNDLVSNVIRKVSKEDSIAGTYKGHLFINEYRQSLNEEDLQFRKQTASLLNLLMKKNKVHMFLYVIEAANLQKKDKLSNSDPYLVVRGGKQQQSFKKQYFNDQPNPQFLKKIHMILNFPQDASLDLQVWDYDPVVADQIIGSVTIDIENRIQAKLADARFNNPIQTHNLTLESSKRSKGLIRFWLDLVPVENISLYRQFQISNKSALTFQVRIIVWSCDGMPNNDIEDMSDLYVQCMFNGEIQQTDVHYRSATGFGSFNWRMVFPVKLPIKNPMLTFKVYDKDIITSNDYLASASFSIRDQLQQAFQTNSSVTLFLGTQDLAKQSEVPGSKKHIINGQQMYDRFQIKTQNRAQAPPVQYILLQNQIKQQGKIQLSVQILTQEDAKKNPAGKGRQTPNQHPYLPNPKGRFQFSLNPITMISQLCGPKAKKAILLALCAVLFIGLIVYFGVTFGGSLVGSIVAKAV